MNICDTNPCDATIPARYVPFSFPVAASWQPKYFRDAKTHRSLLLRDGVDALYAAGLKLGAYYNEALDVFEATKVVPRSFYLACFDDWSDHMVQDHTDALEAAATYDPEYDIETGRW